MITITSAYNAILFTDNIVCSINTKIFVTFKFLILRMGREGLRFGVNKCHSRRACVNFDGNKSNTHSKHNGADKLAFCGL